jgi:hypothetical protein
MRDLMLYELVDDDDTPRHTVMTDAYLGRLFFVAYFLDLHSIPHMSMGMAFYIVAYASMT